MMCESQLQLVYTPSGLIGLPGRRKTAYQQQSENAEVVLVNFKTDGNNVSHKWHKHDWQYEAEYYRKHNIPIRVLF